MKNALEFAASEPRYQQRKIDWHEVWDKLDKWEEKKRPQWKETKLYIERLVNKQIGWK